MDMEKSERLSVGEALYHMLAFRHASTKSISDQSKYSQEYFEGVINGKIKMTEEFASELERLLFVKPDFWNKFVS